MNPMVHGRRVVVTGGSPVTTHLATSLERGGARVELLDCEFRTEAEVASALGAAAQALGGVDQVVHTWMAAELSDPTPFAEVDEATWLRSCEGTLAAGWWLMRQAGPLLRASAPASLVCVVPTVGLTGAAELGMLATVAEGLRVLAKGAGRQWGADGVTVHTITAAPEHWVPRAADGSLLRAISLSVPAMGGRGDLEDDVAPLVAMLGSPDAHFWTSGTVVADGGVWMAL